MFGILFIYSSLEDMRREGETSMWERSIDLLPSICAQPRTKPAMKLCDQELNRQPFGAQDDRLSHSGQAAWHLMAFIVIVTIPNVRNV